MHRPKIEIQRKKILDNAGHFRYYRMGFFSLDHLDIRYPLLIINTEKQLMTFVYNSYGWGEYLIKAFIKGRRGMWVFWHGIIDERGWQFNTRFQQSSEMRSLNRELRESIESGDEELVRGIKEDIEFQKEQDVQASKSRKYGFNPFLKSSGKRGIFHMWEEPDIAFKEKESEDIYG